VFKSKIRALTTSISNILGLKVKRAPELIVDGALAVIKTVVDNKREYVWGIDIGYPTKIQDAYNYQRIWFNYDRHYKESADKAIYQMRQINLPERKRAYNFMNPVFDASPREFIETYLEDSTFIAPDKQEYQIYVTDKNLDKVLSEGKITAGEHNLAQRRFKEYTVNIRLSPITN
jgi:hypothetical protein